MGKQFSNASMPSLLTTPLQLLAAWFVPAQSAARQRRISVKPQQLVLPFTSETLEKNANAAVDTPPGKPGVKASLRNGLHIVRVFDSAVSPSCAGRMVISGRMSDVCAELERMSQAQASTR